MLQRLSDLGITLLLFLVGLKLDVRTLARPQVWAVASLHMSIVVLVLGTAIDVLALAGTSFLTGIDFSRALLIAFALSSRGGGSSPVRPETSASAAAAPDGFAVRRTNVDELAASLGRAGAAPVRSPRPAWSRHRRRPVAAGLTARLPVKIVERRGGRPDLSRAVLDDIAAEAFAEGSSRGPRDRMLCDWLVVSQVPPRGTPRRPCGGRSTSLPKGATPVLSPVEARKLLVHARARLGVAAIAVQSHVDARPQRQPPAAEREARCI